MINRLTVCTWDASGLRTDEIHSPEWSEVEVAIRALDQKTRNDLYLHPSDRDDLWLCIGGGAGRYVVTGSIEESQFPTMLDRNRPSQSSELVVVGGQASEFRSDMILDLERALECARMFFLAGGFVSEDGWVDYRRK